MSALSALGVAPEIPSFPAVVACPLCRQNTLHLFDDILTDGVWLHCNSCLAHGDIITFAAQIWNTSLPAVLTKLADLGVLSATETNRVVGEYTRAVNRVQVAEQFWVESSQQIWNHENADTATWLRELGVREEITATAGLVGVAHPDQIVSLCRALGRAKPAAVRKNGAGIVFPYYDLPGRLTGFLLLHGNKKQPIRIFVPLTAYDKRKANAGYFLLNNLLAPEPAALKGKQFIVEDPLWALTEQCRQLRHNFKLLPIVASYVGEEAVTYGVNWAALGPATRVFQTTVLTPEVTSQAATAGGYVALSGLQADRRPSSPKYTWQRLAGFYRSAVPWHKSLNDALTAANELTAYSFATRLTAPHEKLQKFFHRYGKNFREDFSMRVLQAINVAPADPTRVHKKWTIIEQENTWFSHTGQLICNARVIIEKIIQADDKKQYAGRIYQKDWSLEFIDDARRIEGMGLLAYAAALAAPAGKIITFDRAWNKRSHLIALQLHEPTLVLATARIGWDTGTKIFRFGDYALNNAGEIDRTTPAIQLPEFAAFPEPGPIAPLTIRQFLTPSAESAFVWNIFSAVAANLIAPATNKDCAAVAVQADVFDAAAKIGRALNCRHDQTTNLQRGSAAAFVKSRTGDDSWPVFVSSLFDETLLMLSVTKAHNQPVCVKMLPTGAAVALGYGWRYITASEKILPPADLTALRHVLPAYIQRILRHRLTLVTKHKDLHLAVLQDVHEWLGETYGDTFYLPLARNKLKTPADAHTVLMTEIYAAIRAGHLDLLPRPRRKDQPKNYLLRRKEAVWINRRAVDNYMHAGKNIPPNWLTIIDLLLQAGVYKGEEVVHNMPGFLVNTEWCEQFWIRDSLSAREIG